MHLPHRKQTASISHTRNRHQASLTQEADSNHFASTRRKLQTSLCQRKQTARISQAQEADCKHLSHIKQTSSISHTGSRHKASLQQRKQTANFFHTGSRHQASITQEADIKHLSCVHCLLSFRQHSERCSFAWHFILNFVLIDHVYIRNHLSFLFMCSILKHVP